jgi:sugar phosphate isomerase/epimerase
MKLAISNIAWEKKDDNDVWALLKQYGFTGLEIAPSRLIEVNPYHNLKRAADKAQYLKEEYGLEIPSVQALLFGRKENIFKNTEERKVLMDYLKKAVSFAHAINCPVLVFGSPKNRNMMEVNEKNWKIAQEFFTEIADEAAQKKVALCLEANPSIYGTNFVNSTPQAIEFVRKINKPGLGVNLDFGTLILNAEGLPGSADFDLIKHIHISEPYLALIEAREEHQKLAVLLKKIGYGGYVSIEMRAVSENALALIEKTLAYIAEIFG